MQVALGFLAKGKRYAARVYSDETRMHIRIQRFLVSADTVIKAAMTPQGGLAVRIVPATDKNRFSPYGR